MSTFEERATARLENFDGTWYPKMMFSDREQLDSITNLEVGGDDVLVATYPKSGTAWMLRILTLIRNEVDVGRTDDVPLSRATKMIELEKVDAVLSDPEPRIIKTHLAYAHIPRSFGEGKSKIIYVARNPRDVSVSFYYHHKLIPQEDQDETFDKFFERFVRGYVHFGSWSEHIKMYWAHRNDPNMLWLTYEDLKKNGKEKISEIARFLGKNLTDEQIETVVRESSFDTMKSKPNANYAKYHSPMVETKSKYMRKGVVGDWKNHYTSEMLQRLDHMVDTEIAPLGLQFDYQ